MQKIVWLSVLVFVFTTPAYSKESRQCENLIDAGAEAQHEVSGQEYEAFVLNIFEHVSGRLFLGINANRTPENQEAVEGHYVIVDPLTYGADVNTGWGLFTVYHESGAGTLVGVDFKFDRTTGQFPEFKISGQLPYADITDAMQEFYDLDLDDPAVHDAQLLNEMQAFLNLGVLRSMKPENVEHSWGTNNSLQTLLTFRLRVDSGAGKVHWARISFPTEILQTKKVGAPVKFVREVSATLN